MIKAVVFDIDGVLIDSFDANVWFFKNIFEFFGYKSKSPKHYKRHRHMTARDYISLVTLRPKNEITNMLDFGKSAPYPTHLWKIPKNSTQIIKLLHKSYKIALVTNRTNHGMKIYHDFSRLKKYFDVSICFDDVTHPKPHPQSLLLALKKLKVKANEAVYIGDTKADLQTARGAKTYFIGFSKKKIPGADFTTNSFAKLPNLIKKLDYVQK